MSDDKKRINAFVPSSLYEQVMSKGYATTTEAIITGFERLIEDSEPNIPKNTDSLNPELGLVTASLSLTAKSICYSRTQLITTIA